MFWNQEVEMLSRNDMVARQNHKLIKFIERVYEKSGFYNKRIERCEIKPEDMYRYTR